MKDKIYKYLGFAARARKIAVGMTAVEQSAKKGRTKLIIVGEEVGTNSLKKLKKLCEKYNVRLMVFGKCEELSHATGKQDKGIFALEDENLTKAVISEFEKGGFL